MLLTLRSVQSALRNVRGLGSRSATGSGVPSSGQSLLHSPAAPGWLSRSWPQGQPGKGQTTVGLQNPPGPLQRSTTGPR